MGDLLVPHAALSAGLARRYVVQDVLACGASNEVADDAALVVTELVGNAVRHGPAASGGGIRVTWSLDGDLLHLAVAAGGRGPAPTAVRTPVGSSDDESGRGLGIVALLAHAWGVRQEDGGNVVWASIACAVPAGPRGDARRAAAPTDAPADAPADAPTDAPARSASSR